LKLIGEDDGLEAMFMWQFNVCVELVTAKNQEKVSSYKSD